MIISEKLTFSIKTNLYQSIKSYLIDHKQIPIFCVEDIIKVYKHKTQKDNKHFWFPQKLKISISVSVKNCDDIIHKL